MALRRPRMLGRRGWDLLGVVGWAGCGATALGFLGRFHWFLDLFSHFRAQYAVGLAVLAAGFLVGRRRRAAAVFGAVAVVNAGCVFPLYVGGAAPWPEGAPGLRAMLINVNTYGGDTGRVGEAIREASPDLVVLEEISAQWVDALSWLAASHPHTCLQPRDDNFGIGLYSRLPLSEREVVRIGRAGVPSIVAQVETGQGPLRLLATHPLPPVGAERTRLRNEQLSQLPEFINANEPWVVIGDLNTTPWNHAFRRLAANAGLLDSLRGRGFQATWPTFLPVLGIPLDHVLHTPPVRVRDRRVGGPVGSDHLPVIVEFGIVGPGAGQRAGSGAVGAENER